MDPVSASVSGVDLSSEVSVKVARTALDSEQQAGDAAVSMLKQVADLQKSENAKPGHVDVYA